MLNKYKRPNENSEDFDLLLFYLDAINFHKLLCELNKTAPCLSRFKTVKYLTTFLFIQ